MKVRLATVVKLFCAFVLVFVVQKPFFILWHHTLFPNLSLSLVGAVCFHGLPLDVALAGYLTALPLLVLLASVWLKIAWWNRFLRVYLGLMSIPVSLAFVVNLGLYPFWKVPLDSTPVFYFLSSPRDAFASVSLWFILGAVLVALLHAVCFVVLCHWLGRAVLTPIKQRLSTTFLLLLCCGMLFLAIRGGVTVSATNTGKVYFSEQAEVNHAAVNPLFSLIESLAHDNDFASRYRFMDDKEAHRIFAKMVQRQSSSTRSLLKEDRPDVLLIILESFSSRLMSSLGGDAPVAVELDKLGREGVLFTNFYANSFRTDRGVLSILSGYPAQPTMSLMKYPNKTAHLPSIAGSLIRQGYKASYYYGGDIDFCNQRSYLVSQGFSSIVADTDFPLNQRMSKWGVPDGHVFERLLADLRSNRLTGKRFMVLQTSSSHEPFDVPYHKLSDKVLNAFAYADSCVGNFVRELKKKPRWKHTLVVLVPDHLGSYPHNIDNTVPERYRIPLIFTGGAVQKAEKINVTGSQQDLAATLLAQLNLPHDEFTFSKNMLDDKAPHFAFFTVPDLFGVATDSGTVIFDNKMMKNCYQRGKTEHLQTMGKAYLQVLYDDINKR